MQNGEKRECERQNGKRKSEIANEYMKIENEKYKM